MPATPPLLSEEQARLAAELGSQIRHQRKLLKVSATAAAEAAGMARMTWHRLEKGEVSVTIGAYMLAANTIGLRVQLVPANTQLSEEASVSRDGWIPVSISLSNYPQLKQIAWHVTGVDVLTPVEAMDIYERNWRHVDQSALSVEEWQLINALKIAFGKESVYVSS